MLLSAPAIKKHLEFGRIAIDPFDELNLGSCQYDVTLGGTFWRRINYNESVIHNPYDPECGWDLDSACPAKLEKQSFKNVGADDGCIVLQPGEIILGHTKEFIGSRCDSITTMMKARSSVGRNMITVCSCAGMGDVGYCNRWTMEIKNQSRDQPIVLVAGRRIAQILFFEVEPVGKSNVYSGKYQPQGTLGEIKAKWKPEDMLPKMWLDRECKE